MEPQKSKYTINDSLLRLIIIQVQNLLIMNIMLRELRTAYTILFNYHQQQAGHFNWSASRVFELSLSLCFSCFLFNIDFSMPRQICRNNAPQSNVYLSVCEIALHYNYIIA